MQKSICLRANVETGVFLIPLNLYLFSSLLWNVPPALWLMYKEELFKIQLEEGQFKISPTWLVSNQLPVKFSCSHLNSPVTDTDPPWIMSVLTKLLFQPTLATAQGYPEVFYSPSVKFSLPVFDIQNLGHSRCHWDAQQVIQNMLDLCFYTASVFKSRPTKNYYFCRWCLAISTYFITLLLHRVLSHLM